MFLFFQQLYCIYSLLSGSSTGQAPGRDSEVYLNPVAYYRDPFRPEEHNYLVLCECVLPDGITPIPSNTRRASNEIMSKAKAHEPWFGLEQEYVLFANDGTTVLGTLIDKQI